MESSITLEKTVYDLYPTYVSLWKDICRIETPSDDRDALNRMADYVKAFAERRGFDIVRIPFERAGDCLKIVYDAHGSKEPPILLMAHMDTVHPFGAFGAEVVREENGRVFGPGVVDCKGGIAIALLCMESLKAVGFAKRPVELLLTADEEISGRLSAPDGADLIRKEAAAAYAVINCETGVSGAVTVGRKGIAHLRVTVRGRAAHAGNSYFEGVSAIQQAARQMIRIEENSSAEEATYNCGTIRGGTVPNAVPETCEYVVDIRSLTSEGLQAAVETVKRIVTAPDMPGAQSEVEMVSMRPPMERKEANDALLAKINNAARACNSAPFAAIVRGGGSDAAYTVQMGTPTVCSCGLEGGGEHTLREWGDPESLRRRAYILSEAIRNYI